MKSNHVPRVYKLSLAGIFGGIIFGLISIGVNLFPLLSGTWSYNILGHSKEMTGFVIGTIIFLGNFIMLPIAAGKINEYQ